MAKILSRAPVRIDLAGGTLDIWPIYLLLRQATTLNAAIDLWAEATLEIPRDKIAPEVHLCSFDQGGEWKGTWKDLLTAEFPFSVQLQGKLLSYFYSRFPNKKPKKIVLSTRAKSPAGAGLGGSSALNVALTGALASHFIGSKALKSDLEKEKLIDICRDVETQILGVPAGLQDYYGAMFGGLQELCWKPAIHERRTLSPSILRSLEKRILLFYSGQSRNSGINNWQLFKAVIDRDPEIVRRFQEISAATHELAQALKKKNDTAAILAIQKEWTARRGLASGISTPEIDQALKNAQQEADVGFKICGAGGGGCFLILLPNSKEDLRKRVRKKVISPHIRELPFRAVARGLEVKRSS